MVVGTDHLVERTDGVHQMSVHGAPVSCAHGGVRCGDEPPCLQHRHILAHGVLTHPHRLPDVPVAGPALVGLPVLQILQIAVDRQLSMPQSQQEDLVGEREKMCEFLATYKRFFADNMGRLMITRSVKDMGLIHCEKVINGKRRHWLLYIPSSYKTGKKKSFPLVMAIPGYSCNDWYLAQISDWHVVGEKRDFFVVYPCAFPGSTPSGCVPLPMWKSGEMYPNDREDNEIFLKKVVEDTCEKYPIDQSRIFVSGHSNGSKMTQELLCAYPGLFTAAAPIGFVCGELGTNLLRNIPDNVGPIWYIKGENDIGIACDMDENLANQGMINILCKINHVSEKPVIYRNGKYESLIYYNENHVPVVKFTKVIDMPHAQTPEMSLMIWDEFFSRFRRMPGGTVSYVW